LQSVGCAPGCSSGFYDEPEGRLILYEAAHTGGNKYAL
jgi:hypothetical protein